MPVEFYISRDPQTKQEVPFDTPFEREAAIIIARSMWRAYARGSKEYFVLFNVQDPPADIIVISQDGLGIADMKDVRGPIRGDKDSAWEYVDTPGATVLAGSFVNPFIQVQNYSGRVFAKLKDFAEEHHQSIPPWIVNDSFRTQLAVIFTHSGFDLSHLRVQKTAWFSFKWLHEFADWAQSLTFGSQHRKLNGRQLRMVASDLFHTEPWVEIDKLLHQAKLYGILRYVKDNEWDNTRASVDLNLDELSIGRGDDRHIRLLRKDFPKVSRLHAVIRRTPESVAIYDDSSSNGTWVNGKRVGETGYPLKPGDRIVLGIVKDNGTVVSGSCEFEFRPPISPKGPEYTQKYASSSEFTGDNRE